jgi:hypothetical protein
MTTSTERIVDILHEGPFREWDRDELAKSRVVRFAQAYLILAEEKYRPEAPGDGCGGIYLSDEELADRERLHLEAAQYGVRFYQADDSHQHWVGCSNYTTNRALVLIIEAARQLCGSGDEWALRLLQRAVKEIRDADGTRKNPKLRKPPSRPGNRECHHLSRG